jgi:hypothetical protein
VDYWPLEVANQRQILGALPAFCFPSASFLISQISLETGYSLCSHHFVLTSALGSHLASLVISALRIEISQ